MATLLISCVLSHVSHFMYRFVPSSFSPTQKLGRILYQGMPIDWNSSSCSWEFIVFLHLFGLSSPHPSKLVNGVDSIHLFRVKVCTRHSELKIQIIIEYKGQISGRSTGDQTSAFSTHIISHTTTSGYVQKADVNANLYHPPLWSSTFVH